MLDEFKKAYGRASDVVPNVDKLFIDACLFVLTEAFKRMESGGRYEQDWKETRFSALLIGCMDDVQRDHDLPLRIDPECYQYSQEVLRGQADPDAAPRIDITMSGGWTDRDVYYGIEGKVLVEEDWGTRRASYLRSRYIDTGIDNFVSGRYSPVVPAGCIAGYIVQGKPSAVASRINRLLKKRGRASEALLDQHKINGCSGCYKSEHLRQTDAKKLKLRHVLLPFEDPGA